MPIASGAGHWPKEHLVSPAPAVTPKPSGPGYVQSYMPQWVPPNKVLPPKTSYVMASPSPSNPKNPYPSPNYPNGGQGNPGYDTPPPRYNSGNPKRPDGYPDTPRNGNRNPYNQGRNTSYNTRPQEPAKAPRMFRASEKYGQPGHNRFGIDGARPENDFGHNKYGVRYDSSRQVVINSRGTQPVGPKGLESYELYGPRMNMTTGLCGPQMRPCCAMLGGLLALAALGGILAGIGLGVKSKMDAASSLKKFTYVNPLRNIRYYQQNGAFEPCVDRYATTTPIRTTTRPVTTTRPTTTITTKATTTRTTTTCIPVTLNTETGITACSSGSPGCTTVTHRSTTVCIIVTPAPTTIPESTTTTQPTTTTTIPTTTPPLTTATTLPFCDTLTTTYTLITLYPLELPRAGASNPWQTSGGGTAFLVLLVSLLAKFLFV